MKLGSSKDELELDDIYECVEEDKSHNLKSHNQNHNLNHLETNCKSKFKSPYPKSENFNNNN